MTRDDIIRMAREAGLLGKPTYINNLEAFAALVASAEHKRVQQVYTDAATDSVKAAIAYEREACAKWLEDVVDAPNWAEAIRARGQA